MTQPDEQWRPVVGYEGLYEVSDHGRVRSSRRLLRQYNSGSGRLAVNLSRGGRQARVRVAFLVLTAFVGPRPDGLDACHNNGDVTDNRRSNLRWDTRSANMHDAVGHGTHNNARKTHCKRGHLLQEPNLSPAAIKDGQRACLSCLRATSARWKARRDGRPFPGVQAVADQNYTLIMTDDSWQPQATG